MITMRHVGGVGVNSHYVVERDGARVGTIRRFGRSRFVVESVHYQETIETYPNIDSARAAVAKIDYPDAWKVYETICQRVEQERRAYRTKFHQGAMVEAVRDLVAGSNSAHGRLAEMVADIEAFAKDRSVTYAAIRQRAIETETFISGEPRYPDPPAAK
jgi:hypothetical protein